jgi:hypothetical protein
MFRFVSPGTAKSDDPTFELIIMRANDVYFAARRVVTLNEIVLAVFSSSHLILFCNCPKLFASFFQRIVTLDFRIIAHRFIGT